jgi:hypothetical protein
MGRGRQKAKHTKVARELKYFSPAVDLTALERELAASAENELVDKWADLYPDEDEAEPTDGETGETVADLEDVIETEDIDEVRDQLGDVDDDSLENKD